MKISKNNLNTFTSNTLNFKTALFGTGNISLYRTCMLVLLLCTNIHITFAGLAPTTSPTTPEQCKKKCLDNFNLKRNTCFGFTQQKCINTATTDNIACLKVCSAIVLVEKPKETLTPSSPDKSLSSKPETSSTSMPGSVASTGTSGEIVGCLKAENSYVGTLSDEASADEANAQFLVSASSYKILRNHLRIGYIFDNGLLCLYNNKELCLGKKILAGDSYYLALLNKSSGVKFKNPTSKSGITIGTGYTETGYKADWTITQPSGGFAGVVMLLTKNPPKEILWVSPGDDNFCKEVLKNEGAVLP